MGVDGIVGRVLAARPVMYVGKISYGLYVYHPFMPDVCRWMLRHWAPNVALPWPVIGGASMVLTFVVAALSWRFVERPFNDLKRYF